MGCNNNNFRNYNNNSNFMRDTRRNNYTADRKNMCRFPQEDDIDKMPIAMAYVPWQQWNDVYDLETAFQCGTIFPELNLPFTGRCI